ncbi:NAD(P)-binding protein [Exidia glandulosa HHB12029]|uniref:NAD(P)-binding protein n=1 Tax=Exidia glandulosa HHB12029 TaxID=1314781 RepID=A0A165H5G4_EXIGL|nr:NAD(P)-binding protein [Exidia glandulosa HHB12029]
MASPVRVLVTGSSGHLGAALVLHLQSLAYNVEGVDLLPSSTTHAQGDITSIPFLRTIFEACRPTHILHTATLHKPHVESHSVSSFVATNVQGTVNLLELAVEYGVQAFIFTSTTSTFGKALQPAEKGGPTVWIDETVIPIPKNIYGVTKVCAEDICALFHAKHGLPILILRTSRFFPEQDDTEAIRNAFEDDNIKVNELCYRRVDLYDVATAHVCAMERATELKWGRYIISAPTPFSSLQETLVDLGKDAPRVLETLVPFQTVYSSRKWKFFDVLDRVYDSSKAIADLGWKPVYTFARAVDHVAQGKEWRSPLSIAVGKRGYHAETTGVYTVR